MSYERLAYDDQDTTGRMHDDCLVCASEMRLPHQALSPETFPEGMVPVQRKPRKEIQVSDAAAHLASRLHLGHD